MLTELALVEANCSTRPLVSSKNGRVEVYLASDKVDDVVGQLAATIRETANSPVGLELQSEPLPSRFTYVSHQLPLDFKWCPITNKVLKVEKRNHARALRTRAMPRTQDPRFPMGTCSIPANRVGVIASRLLMTPVVINLAFITTLIGHSSLWSPWHWRCDGRVSFRRLSS